MPWKNKSSVGTIVILLAALGLVLGSGSGLAKVASEKTPALISLDVQQMDLQDVLRLIAEKANVNIIAGREVTGEVTLRLKNVDLWQALDAVLGASGFTYREEEGIIRVVKAKELGEVKMPLLETKIIFLKFAKAEDVKEAFQHLLSASGTMGIDPTSNALIVTDIPEDIENIEKRVVELEEAAREKAKKEEIEKERIEEVVESLKKRVVELEEVARVPTPVPERKRFELNYINVEEKKGILTGVLDDMIGEEGEFFLDSLTNSVSVIAPSSYIKEVEEYFEGADVAPKRIMIRAEFVEVSLTALKDLGIKWRWKGAYEEYPLGATFRYPYYARPEPGEEVPEAPAPLSTRRGDPPWGMGIIFGSVEQELRGIIDMLISKRKADLLSSPSIVTLDGKEARIHVGVDYPYKIKSWKEGELFETTEFLDLGATLEVTPHVKEEKRVVLDIHPFIKEVTERERWEGGPPVVGTRETQTKIEVEDGKTIVIGGLLRNTEAETREGVPFLSRLPILGSLFTRKEITAEQTDLLIFITPNILREKLEEEDIVEKRKPLKVQVDELYQKGLDYKKLGEYEKAGECFEEVISRSRMFGFSDYLKYAEKELADLEKLEEKRIEKEKREKARLEKERLEEEKQERIRQARLEKERERQERIEKAQLEREKRILEKKRKEEEKQERIRQAKLERQRKREARIVKKLYQKGLGYKKKEEYEKARQCFEDVLKKSRIYGFSDYLKYAEKELADLERLAKKGLPDEKTEMERFEKMEKWWG